MTNKLPLFYEQKNMISDRRLKQSCSKSARKYYFTSLFTLLQTRFLSDFQQVLAVRIWADLATFGFLITFSFCLDTSGDLQQSFSLSNGAIFAGFSYFHGKCRLNISAWRPSNQFHAQTELFWPRFSRDFSSNGAPFSSRNF